jgi:hypothetical protein
MVEGRYGATVGETGPEEPDVLIVPAARIYDLVPVRELPYGPAAPSLHQRPDGWQHPTTCQPSSKPLALGGASTDEFAPGSRLPPENPVGGTVNYLKSRLLQSGLDVATNERDHVAFGKSMAWKPTPDSIWFEMKATLRARRSSLALIKVAL